MPKGQNKEFKVAGIKNLMKTNYNVAPALIDVEMEVDETMSMAENWYALKGRVLMLSPKYLSNFSSSMRDIPMEMLM